MLKPVDLVRMSAVEAMARMKEGAIAAEALTRAHLDRIGEVDASVRAWAFVDPEHAIAQARALDERRAAGRPLGSLHGLPVGVKDIFDTFDMPTEDGTALHAGRRPVHDATAVSLLRGAGAVLLGKTVTTELAGYTPGKTRNPLDPARTPGGSSSGSAAAVAARMTPLAIGTQTAGSVIRPAAYCGICGFKPTHGLISRHGVLPNSRLLDHVGVFARSLADCALIAEALMVFDPRDPDMKPRPRPALLGAVSATPPVAPRLGFVRTPMWDRAHADTRAGLEELAGLLGGQASPVELPSMFEGALEWHAVIDAVDTAISLARDYTHAAEGLSAALRADIERGRQVRAVDYNEAVARREALNALLGPIFDEYDALITPAVVGEAETGLGSTGDPLFCKTWSLVGAPALSVPLLEGSGGMPIGVQLVGPRGDDARLLRTARWLVERVEAE